MRYLRNEPLKKHTSLKVGGTADYFCAPKNIEEIKKALQFAKENKLAVAILGAGTNVLVLDRGVRGLVLKLAGGLNWIKFKGSKVFVGGGVLLPRLIRALAWRGLSNLEFLAGIPGSVGGAAVMNAGAYGREIGKYIREVRVLDKEGREKIIKGKNLKFGYRGSVFLKNKWIIIEAVLKLVRRKGKNIAQKIKECLLKRRENQPLGSPNCGSVFKNPKGDFAGRLIEEAGCKGMRIGDAQVSRKHANFIINLGEAKARDIIKLMARIQKLVKVQLEPEIRILCE